MNRGTMRATLVIVAAWMLVVPVLARESADGMKVAESGVGTAVSEDRALLGAGDSFAEGTQVVFWTRVVGGQDGDAVDHVWIRDGKEVLVIGLPVGSPDWRTWSRKTLHPGSAGDWAVEARDRDGRVLARAEFACTGTATD